MTAEQIRLAMENKLEYLMEVKPQLASDDQLYKAAALVLRDLMVENAVPTAPRPPPNAKSASTIFLWNS